MYQSLGNSNCKICSIVLQCTTHCRREPYITRIWYHSRELISHRSFSILRLSIISANYFHVFYRLNCANSNTCAVSGYFAIIVDTVAAIFVVEIAVVHVVVFVAAVVVVVVVFAATVIAVAIAVAKKNSGCRNRLGACPNRRVTRRSRQLQTSLRVRKSISFVCVFSV